MHYVNECVFSPEVGEPPSTLSPGSQTPRGPASSSPLQPWKTQTEFITPLRSSSQLTSLSFVPTYLYCSLACITMKSHLWFIHLCSRLYCSWGAAEKWRVGERPQAKNLISPGSPPSGSHLLVQLQDSFLAYVSFRQVDRFRDEG